MNTPIIPRIALVALSILSFLPTYSQTTVYQPLKDVGSNEHVLSRLDSRYKLDLKNISGPYKDKITALYAERYKEIRKQVVEGNFFYATDINDYVNAVYEEILKANPSIPANEIQILVCRDTDPNALSYGEGTIAVNIGLLKRLENESQLAFVLCHEIAHYMLRHSDKQINASMEVLYSKNTQKELNRISRSEYGQTTQAMELLKQLTLGTRRYSRDYEKQADSLGFALLRNTAYDENEAISCLHLLDHIDEDPNPNPPDVTSIYNFPQYPFKSEWIESDGGGITMTQEKSAEDKMLEDSMKTHPDCKERILLLERYGTSTGKKVYLQSEEAFKRIIYLNQFECAESSYDKGNLSRCIYQCWELQQKYPNDSYPVTTAIKCMNDIYQAMLDHRANMYIPNPSPDFHPPYNNLLRMFHVIRGRDVASLNYYYMSQYQSQYTDEEFVYTSYRCAMTYADPVVIADMRERYLKAYPNGKYVNQLK